MTEITVHQRRLWAMRLGEEHSRICWQYGLDLRPPVMELIKSKVKWGAFLAGGSTCCIQVSERLIGEHSWDVVLQVLKHEMAHQLVFQTYGIAAGHGREFNDAAARLGLDERFSGASGDLPRTIVQSWQEEGREGKLHKKVRKLLRLASSDNEHEAQLAMRKAGQLIARYNLDIISRDTAPPVNYKIIPLHRKRLGAEVRGICSLLRQHFFVEVVLSSLYDAENDADFRTVELIGNPANLENAEYIFHFLRQRLQSGWQQYRLRTESRENARKGYLLGMLDGFAVQLSRNFADGMEGSGRITKALALVSLEENRDIKSFVQRRFPRLTVRRSRAGLVNARSYGAGHAEGLELTWLRAVERKRGDCKPLIEG